MSNTKRPARKLIIEALVSLLQEMEYQDIKVKKLVREAGVNPSTYYYNFHGIDEVADALMELFFQSYRDSFQWLREVSESAGELSDSVWVLMHDIVRYVYDNRQAFLAIVKSGKIEAFRRSYTDTVLDVISKWEIRPFDASGNTVVLNECQVEYLMRGTVHQFVAYLEIWANHGFDMDPDELVSCFFAISAVLGVELVSYHG